MAAEEGRLQGGCLCGAIRYRLAGHADSVALCHCEFCRRHSGGPAVAWLEVRRTDLSWTGASPDRYEYASDLAPVVRRTFCGACGSSLTWERAGAETIDVATGTLDDPTVAAPTHHCWAPRQLDWLRTEDGLPRHERGVPDDD